MNVAQSSGRRSHGEELEDNWEGKAVMKCNDTNLSGVSSGQRTHPKQWTAHKRDEEKTAARVEWVETGVVIFTEE